MCEWRSVISGEMERALTFDMSGGWRQAKLAGGRPLDEGVRALVEEKHFLGRKPHFKNRPMGAETGRGPLLYKPELSNLGGQP